MSDTPSAANASIQDLLEDMVHQGPELGLQVSAYLHGKQVIDAFAGIADEASGRPVTGDTMFTVFSTSKGVATTCVHLLAERGQLDYDDPIAKYWPEFGAHGKDKATIRDALTHKTGLPTTPPIPESHWDEMCAALAAAEPEWEPGTKTGYHGFTWGFIVGEVVRRIDRRGIGQFLQEEVCRPLGISSLYFGVPDSELGRVATVKPLPPAPSPVAPVERSASEVGARSPADPAGRPRSQADVDPFTNALKYNTREYRQAIIPAGGGVMSARGLARHYAMLAEGGTLDGVTVLSPERLRIATTLQTADYDQTFGRPAKKALGWWIADGAMGSRETTFGHAGLGGSIGFADGSRHFAFALTKNVIGNGGPNAPAGVLVKAVEQALGLTG